MSILLTGGLGFIGSHTCVILLNNDYDIVIIDNLSNSKIKVLDNIKKLTKNPNKIHFYKGDVNNTQDLTNIFSSHNIDAVIHFASLKAVSESINLPLLYYKNNINGLINILDVMKNFNCNKIIFSSSATVYGSKSKSPLSEDMITGTNITNPYGQTKYMQEQILFDYKKINPELIVTILRYFNPIGAHLSGLLGEDPVGIPNNLFPYLLRSIFSNNILSVFGNDYDTRDGTCIRDFIHVMDLAEAHYITLKQNNNKNVSVYNLGMYSQDSNNGTTVLELINTFEKINNVKIPYKFCERRQGDIDIVFAESSKIYNELGWRTKYTLEDICKDGYNYLLKQK